MHKISNSVITAISIILLLPYICSAASSVTVDCDSYKMDLSGATTVMGVLYREHVILHKVNKSGNAQGKWKLTAFEQEIIYPNPIPVQINRVDQHDLGHGMWMKVQSTVQGNIVKTKVLESNAILDVVDNQIGYQQTGVWCGTINGREVSFKWDRGNQYEPELKGNLVLKGERLKVSIVAPTANERFVFSETSPGVLSFTAKATVSPSGYKNDLVWEVEKIDGSILTLDPANARGSEITIKFTNLPTQNKQFGPKKLIARLVVEDCKAEASQSVRIFFPTFAKNNPSGNIPNWFYYWNQTPARVGPARYGGSMGQCAGSSRENLLGYYRSTVFDSVYYICNLQRLGDKFPFDAKQNVGGYMETVRVTGIDTFAVASQHENAHYTHAQLWWKQYHTTDKFKDTNRNGILDDKEQLLDKDKDLVPDASEPQYSLNPNNKNTFGIGPDGDDEEYLAWQAETAWNAGSANTVDWARPGKQWP